MGDRAWLSPFKKINSKKVYIYNILVAIEIDFLCTHVTPVGIRALVAEPINFVV